MCGFFLSICNEDNFYIRQNSQSLNHRGPDANQDFEIFDDKINFCKGDSNYHGFFNRLSIRGSNENQMQPIKLSNNKILLYNGEIYNTEFLINKFKLITHNKFLDTKILGEGIDKFGLEFLNYLDGMFALLILDINNKQITIIRDYFGIKPLYFYQSEKNLIVCSELKPIIKSINPSKISINYEYFANSKNMMDEALGQTPFNNIKKLLPQQIIEFSFKNRKIKKLNEKFLDSRVLNQYENKIKNPIEIFKTQISDYKMNDNKSGLLLSSGVDSNVLLKLLNSQNNFTFKSGEVNIDEDIILKKNKKIDNKAVELPAEKLLSFFEKFCSKSYEIEDNIGVAAQMGLYEKVSQNKEIKVVFSGQGADEMFFGYDVGVNLFFQDLINNYNYKDFIINEKLLNNYDDLSWKIKLDKLRDQYLPKFNLKILINNYSQIFNGSFKKNKIKDLNLLLSYFENRLKKRLPKLLRWEDLSSMHYSIETRLPYLNLYYYNIRKELNLKYFFSPLGNKFFLRKFLNSDNRENNNFDQTKKLGYTINSNKVFSLANKDKDLTDISKEINLDITSAYNLSLIYWTKNFNKFNEIKYLLKENKQVFY
ncbi:MAG: hypothetical protein CMK44_00070 [Porticoccus sp.]|nr:hypothetical protein [Porticoccus sp.]